LWRCDDDLFFEVSPLASDALLNKAPPTSRKRAADRLPKLQEDSGTGGFDLSRSFLRL
jgi:hypothetical protein